MRSTQLQVRIGIPVTGGRLVAAAKERGFPVLFSANAFARTYSKGHEREGDFRSFRRPDPQQLAGLDVALDSAGFVAAVRYGEYRWSVSDYLDLVESGEWTWWASMDLCCEPAIAADRPLRLLRIAGTARKLAECRDEAARRGAPAPMPVLQGWSAAEYALCADWLPLTEWPALVGIGSVCRRALHGPDGLLSILDSVDRILPPHVRLHLFGVKSAALSLLANHPRVASVDSMAWDFQARAARRTGRDIEFRVGHMERWAKKQFRVAQAMPGTTGVQSMLFDPCVFNGFTDLESLALEALTLRHADLLMSGDIEYLDAVSQVAQDGATVIALLRQRGLTDATLAAFDELIFGLAEETEELLSRQRSPW